MPPIEMTVKACKATDMEYVYRLGAHEYNISNILRLKLT